MSKVTGDDTEAHWIPLDEEIGVRVRLSHGPWPMAWVREMMRGAIEWAGFTDP